MQKYNFKLPFLGMGQKFKKKLRLIVFALQKQ